MEGDITVVCPKCHHEGHVPPAFAGKTIHCKKCDTHFAVPAAHAAVSTQAVGTPRPVPKAKPKLLPELPPAPPVGGSFTLPDDDVPLTPLTAEEEVHCRERYEARVLSKDRSEQSHDPDLEKEREHERRRAAMDEHLQHAKPKADQGTRSG